jgi:solute:Na+ symporter, SSS family
LVLPLSNSSTILSTTSNNEPLPATTTNANSRNLSLASVAVLLVSAHYGLGFLIGTAEQAMVLGSAGSLYAVSVSCGTLALIALVKIYWTEFEPIWTLLGNRYGKPVKLGVALMSWASLIGIESVQIVAAAAILKVVGIPDLTSMVTLTACFCVLSLLPVEKASWIFRGLLLFNILALFYALWKLDGLQDYWRSPLVFFPQLHQIDLSQIIGIGVSTIAIVTIDMKCQQFIVQARSVRAGYLGTILAALMLFCLAFLPSGVAIAAQHAQIIPPELSIKAVIPYVLAWVGGGSDRLLGIILIIALVVPSLGLGSNVLRIQNKMVFDWEIVPEFPNNRLVIATINAMLALAIALKGGEIVGLIVCFYAAYLSAVWIPFMAYLLFYKNIYEFSIISVRVSLLCGSISALLTLAIALFNPQTIFFNSAELTIMTVGLTFGAIGLLVTQTWGMIGGAMSTSDRKLDSE